MREDGKTATVWFNGPSVRQFLDMPPQPVEIGCNFIEQHRRVDHVCAYDRPVIEKLTKAGLREHVQYWTRRHFKTERFREVPIDQFGFKHGAGFDSGTLALSVAFVLGCEKITLLGFDWHITNDSLYDQDYTWRNGKRPIKFTLAKKNFIEELGEKMHIEIVHDDVRDKYKNVSWIPTKDFIP
tara:strand:- start:938 stop:1486 length:549 start_codon:yes stop_codon:yes gene_type:complete